MALKSHSRYCVNDYIAKMFTKIACNTSSGLYGVRLQVTQPFLKVPCLFSLIKYIPKRHLNYENHLKEYHPWLTFKGIRQSTDFHRCLHSYAFFRDTINTIDM